jgi:acetylornithine deacetylase/succinyl-diaminopimelate desuccinylase-like protein
MTDVQVAQEDRIESSAEHEFLDAHRADMLDGLMEWVRIPSIAAQPERAVDVHRSARWLAGAFREAGLSTELLQTGETTAVFAELLVDEALPTVLVYSHHDVRHAKPEEWMETNPFVPVERDGRVYGRGASDAKGQVIAHLWGLKAHVAARASGRPAVNLKFLVEGEEEMGSPHLAQLIEEETEKFAADVIVFSDTLQWEGETPAMVTSLRGMVSATVEVSGPLRDVHSGAVSGATPNPIHALVSVLSQLHDDSGRIALPGFYDDVEPITEERASELEALPFDEETWLKKTDTRHSGGEEGFSVKERLWARPALEVLSLLSGDPEGIARAVIPSQATAELNVRIVPGQRVSVVAEQLRRFFSERMPTSVEYSLEVDAETGQEPYVSPDGEELDALERAFARGYGDNAVGRMGNAGGGPAELLARTLDAPVLFVGTGLPEDHWHDSDESIDVSVLMKGSATIAHLWTELAESAHRRDEQR